MAVTAKSRGWKHLLALLHAAKTPDELEELLKALLTYEECDQLSLRVELIAELLRAEKPQRQISSELRVSIATVTRGSNMLKTIKSKLRHFFEFHLLQP